MIRKLFFAITLFFSSQIIIGQVTAVKTGLAGNSLIFTSPDHTGDILYFKSSTKTGTNGSNSVYSVTIGRLSLATNTEISTITLTGLESTSSFSFSLQYNCLATDMSGNLYVSCNTLNTIKRFDGPLATSGTQTLNPTYTYTLGSQNSSGILPITMDADGNLIAFCRQVAYRINQADLAGNINGTPLFTAASASPYDIDVYTNGNLLLSSSSSSISEYTTTGTLVRNIALSGNAFSTEVASNGNIYFTTGNNNTVGVWSPCTNSATTLAGVSGSIGNALDAGSTPPYTNARFSRVVNICLRSNGDLLCADENNSTIYKIINPASTLFNYNPVKTAPGNALNFDGATNYAKINNSISNSFTIEYWLQTTQTGSSGSQWYNGKSIVDAFTAANANDFGTALLGSKLAFGIGNPDLTIVSTSSINTGNWVHVAVTRDGISGNIQLYINGSLEATGAGASGTSLNASNFIYIGANASNANNFKGSIDELRIYNAVLTQANIQADMKTYNISVPCSLQNYYYFDNGIAGTTNSGITTVRNIGNNYNPATLFNFTLSGASSNFIESYAMVVPANPTATNITTTGFTANWTAPAVGTVSNYLFDVATDSLFTNLVSGYNGLSVLSTATSQAITGLGSGTKYYYRIRADKTSVTGLGALFCSASATTTSTPAPGNALQFNGTNNYVKLNSTAITSNLSGGKVTVEAWVNFSSYNLESIIKNWGSGSNVTGAFHFGMNGTSGKIQIDITQSNNTAISVTSPNTLALNRWYHVAFSADGTNLSLYENGVLVGSTPYNGTLLTNYPYTFIGAKPNELNSGGTPSGSFAGYLNGKIDELRIWNTGRTQSQISANALNVINASTSGLIAYYKFDQGTSGGTNTGITTLNDETSNANNGTLTNFTLTGTASNWVESYAMVVPVNLSATNITSSGFTANWSAPAIGVVSNYLLDVATDTLFTALVSGYNGLSVASTATAQAITGLTGGTKYFYRIRADKSSVTGTAAIFYSGSATTLITLPIITTQPANSSICPASSTKFYVAATSPLALTYQWQVNTGSGFVNITNGAVYSAATTDTLFITNATASMNAYTYQCVITNGSGSSNSNAATLTIFSLPAVAPITGAAAVCVGSITTLSSTTTGGIWSSSNAAFATVNASGVVTGVAAGLPTIAYTVTNANGCSTQVTAAIIVNALPLSTAITGPSSVCQTSTITLNNVTSGGVWSSGNTAIATITGSGIVTGVTAGTAAINYIVTNANNCSVTNTTNVTVLSQPAKTPIIKDSLICKATNLVVDATVPAAATYAWTASVGGFTSILPKVTITNPALYRVTITLTNGCFYLDSINLRNTSDTAIRAKVLVSSQGFLNDNIVAVNLTNPAPQTAVWTIPNGAQIVSQSTANLILKFANSGKYQVGLQTTSYNVCSSSDSGIVIISTKDTTVNNSSNTVVIREVNVSPNPSTGIFNFAIKLNRSGKVSLSIYSISGTLAYTTVIPESTGVTSITQQVNITGAQKNTYVAVLQTSDSYEVRTLIKN